ncbi:hypothetical protein [Parabacteroides pacaensis]|nr:hypothetical protein [Parabacteroides pacaensis]
MKKNLFYYLFAVICTGCLFTACAEERWRIKSAMTFLAKGRLG